MSEPLNTQEDYQELREVCDQLQSRAERAEAAMAEIRDTLKCCAERWSNSNEIQNYAHLAMKAFAEKAESTDIGKGWLSPDKAKRLREALASLSNASRERFSIYPDCECAMCSSLQLAQQALSETEEK